MQTIGIYCSASAHIQPLFRHEAVKLGLWLGKNKKTLVTGGSNQGLMEVFSKTVRENGGESVGVIPEDFSNRGWFSNYTDRKIIVRDLSERKDVIKQLCDILIAFPGGVGTMDELFDAWSSYNLGFHNKRIILLNINGFFNPLMQQLALFREEKFLHDFLPNPLFIVESVDQCIELLEKLEVRIDDAQPLGYEFQMR
ncbi:MAG TPA: TIGR00730 family Rossman fold protein [Bacteroidales bacterium]|nr:TIGR00730 family Rossman fold protein [Bacteroidales bacterium]